MASLPTCAICGDPFAPARPTSTTCSARCRNTETARKTAAARGDKQRGLGSGGVFYSNLEFVLHQRAPGGDIRTPARINSRWFDWPRNRHSAKPEAFLDLIEQVSPGPYLEMFARRARFGWDYWGDESLSTVEMPS